ncbi:ketose-bisphosphate aldolase, class-II [Xylariaceae sp. FL0804]|nr:ketose-bisphosphate aldolase, class-II [Xylariaceae sp. FL0804]
MSSTNDDWKATNRTNAILRQAEAGGYGVIAAIAYNLEQIQGLVAAAEQARSPLILQFFPWAVQYADGLLVRTAAAARDRVEARLGGGPAPGGGKRPVVAIHLDHAQDADVIRHAADALPFDSIMVDMSHHERADNLRRTAELVAYCHARRVATEAEPGRIDGAEDGVADPAGLAACMTTPEEVDDFVATGVDSLAPAFGNVHGEYGPAGPQLDFARLASIREQIGGRVRIALHGTNGFPEDLLRKCIETGVTKINVNRLVLDDYYEHLRSDAPRRLAHTALIEEGTDKVISLTKRWMEICGSAGKA